jgi:hypothetical protein
MLILLILLGLGTVGCGFSIILQGKANLGLGKILTGSKAEWAGLACVLVGLALIRFNHAMVDWYPNGLGH